MRLDNAYEAQAYLIKYAPIPVRAACVVHGKGLGLPGKMPVLWSKVQCGLI